jgi:16S rRNA (adenine1518-N6/adenine1519-N6)-dimethyltransferase
MSSVRQVLHQYGIRPEKKLGQCFLEDLGTVRRIAALAEVGSGETVVEIGAGLGFLTEELAGRADRVIALEVDPRLVTVLNDRFPVGSNVQIVAGDVLRYDFATASPTAKIKVVGNVPYHISTPILFHLLAYRPFITSMVLMFQKELADRFVAPPGGRDYGIPSVLLARHASVVRLLTVPPTCFYPVPDVISSVLRIVMRDHTVEPAAERRFTLTVRAAFAQRRKTLQNNLRAAGFDDDTLRQTFARAGVDGRRRAETLSVEDFERLGGALNWEGIMEKIRPGSRFAKKVLDKDGGI